VSIRIGNARDEKKGYGQEGRREGREHVLKVHLNGNCRLRVTVVEVWDSAERLAQLITINWDSLNAATHETKE
jgi:hypothetical protein